tara:strand:+ start:30 stop:326 length:297 start_codon:yes stop_codon:yes gene_type:complete
MALRPTFDAELEAMGEGEVRKKLAAGVWNEGKQKAAQAWLDGIQAAGERESSAMAKSHMEAMEKIASRSAGAAWLAAIAAAVSAVAALVSVLSSTPSH